MILPQYIEIKDWFASLNIDYPKEIIPILEDENKWTEVATFIASTGVFARAQVPEPVTISEGKKEVNFRDWRDWAMAVFIIMSEW